MSRQNSGISFDHRRNANNGPGWEEYDFERMGDAIVAHVPNLEHLARFGQLCGMMEAIDHFGSFKGLSKLRSLKIDILLLTGTLRADLWGKPNHLHHPADNLPASLVNLHICSLEPSHLDLDFIVSKASDLNIQGLELSISWRTTTPYLMATQSK